MQKTTQQTLLTTLILLATSTNTVYGALRGGNTNDGVTQDAEDLAYTRTPQQQRSLRKKNIIPLDGLRDNAEMSHSSYSKSGGSYSKSGKGKGARVKDPHQMTHPHLARVRARVVKERVARAPTGKNGTAISPPMHAQTPNISMKTATSTAIVSPNATGRACASKPWVMVTAIARDVTIMKYVASMVVIAVRIRVTIPIVPMHVVAADISARRFVRKRR